MARKKQTPVLADSDFNKQRQRVLSSLGISPPVAPTGSIKNLEDLFKSEIKQATGEEIELDKTTIDDIRPGSLAGIIPGVNDVSDVISGADQRPEAKSLTQLDKPILTTSELTGLQAARKRFGAKRAADFKSGLYDVDYDSLSESQKDEILNLARVSEQRSWQKAGYLEPGAAKNPDLAKQSLESDLGSLLPIAQRISKERKSSKASKGAQELDSILPKEDIKTLSDDEILKRLGI